MNATDKQTLIDLCARNSLEDMLNLIGSYAFQHAHYLANSLPDTAENLAVCDCAFLRAELIANTIANLISTQTVDKNHYT